jgi:hypothetical protein
VRQRCAELWGTYKVMAQVMWKTWAGQRAAELTPQLVVRPASHFPYVSTCTLFRCWPMTVKPLVIVVNFTRTCSVAARWLSCTGRPAVIQTARR